MSENEIIVVSDTKQSASPRKHAVRPLVERGWPVIVGRALNGLILILIGVYFQQDGFAVPVVISALIYLVVFGFMELSVYETTEEIRQEARLVAEQKAAAEIAEVREKLRQTEVSMETFFSAQNFLAWRIAKTGEVITSLIGLDHQHLTVVAGQSLKKLSILNEILEDLCKSLAAIAAKSHRLQLPDAWFRATYMEVRNVDGQERLEYIGWHTQDGNPPRSMSEGKTFSKGTGCAGLAWERKRPVVEDEFKDGHNWRNNYEGQGKNYKSMICVPVMRGSRDFAAEVIGIITVDTYIDRYFGRKDDRGDEERAGVIVRPYASYIAFLTAIDNAVTLVRDSLASEKPPGVPPAN